MTVVKSFEAVVTEQHNMKGYVIAVLDKYLPPGFVGNTAEVGGEKLELLDRSKAVLSNAVAIKGSGDFVGKTVVLDKKYFDRGYKRFYW